VEVDLDGRWLERKDLRPACGIQVVVCDDVHAELVDVECRGFV
jgi:hypothetical protein